MFKAFFRGWGFVPVTDLMNERIAHQATRKALEMRCEEYNTLYNQSFAMAAAYDKLRTEYEAWLHCYHAPTAMQTFVPDDAPACKIIPFKRPDHAA